jgi:N-ethylmaleimide reductase
MKTGTPLLFSEAKLGTLILKNRVVMAPMTRSRAPGSVPNEMMSKYYALRAEAGLIVTEGVSPSPNGLGYARIPGLFNEEHVRGWRKTTDAVHAAGGKIFVQLMHTGRVSHPANLPSGARVLGPSAIALEGMQMWTDSQGMQPYPVPEEMSAEDIRNTVAEYAQSAKLAIEAGFDGVELHGANGYLIDQFLNPASNHRSDAYGGSAENRIRFALEVAEAVVRAIGKERLGIRVSPYGAFNGMMSSYEGIEETFGLLASRLSALGLVYLHIVDHSSQGAPEVKPSVKALLRREFKQTLILSGGYDAERAEQDLQERRGDLVAFGRPFIANPRLVQKLKNGSPLAALDPATLYTPGEKGYLDYPVS